MKTNQSRTRTRLDARQPLRSQYLKRIPIKRSSRLVLLTCVLGAQLINPCFTEEALAMSIRRAPFHQEATRLTLWNPPAWRTLAGCPGATGTNDGPGIGARFSSPTGVAVDATGTAYVADSGNHVIRKVSPAGIVSTVAGQPGINGWRDGPATNALFAGPNALALDADGNLYVADSGNYVLRKISAAGVVTTVAGRPGVSGYGNGTGTNALFGSRIGGVVRDTNGHLYVADMYNYVIRKVSPGGVVSTMAGQPYNHGYQDHLGTNALFGHVSGLVLDGSGNLYVADPDNGIIRKVSPAGMVTTWVGQKDKWGYRDGLGTNAWFSGATGLAIDGSDNVYVAETDNRRIRKITPEGVVSSLGGASWGDYVDGLGPFARFNSPFAVALDPSGHLLVVDSGNHTIRYGGVATESRPQIISQPVSRTAQEGAGVTICVAAQSTAPLTYQWLAQGQLIPGATNTSVVLENLTEMDAGEYRVAVSDGLGYVLSFPASLQVLRARAISHAPLDNWRPLAGPPLQDIHGMARGNGRYVAIGGGGQDWWWGWTEPWLRGAVATSTDGEHWVKQLPITARSLNSVAFGNGTFVVVGNEGTVFTSTNGLEWEAQTLTTEGMPDLQGIIFDQGIFVAVSGDANGSIWTSTDGSNWINRLVDFGISFMAVTAEGGRFLAVGNTIMISTNGMDWEPASVPTNYLGQEILLEHVACANGTFRAAEHWGNEFMAASTNGLNWVDGPPTNGLYLSRLTCGNGQFVAVDMNSGGVCVSTDGQDWTTPALVSSGERTCYQPHLCFDNGLFVATGERGAVFTSSDGKSWALRQQERAIPFAPRTIINVEGRNFAVDGGQGIGTSAKGTDWSLLLTTNYFECIAYGGGTLVAIGGGEQIVSSQDGGETWTDRSPHLNYGSESPWLSRITYGRDVFVAIGGLTHTNGTQRGHLLTSSGGTIWTPVNFAGTNTLSDVTYGDGLFVALFNRWDPGNKEILTSTNGLSWQTAATYPTNWLVTVAFGNGRFVIGTAEGSLITSLDGKTWSQVTVPGVDNFNTIVFGSGHFLAFTSSGLWSSLDGVTWTQCAAPVMSYFQTIAAGDGAFYAVGDDAILYQSGPFERLGNPRWLSNTSLEWTVTGASRINYRVEFSEDFLDWQTLERVTNAPATRSFVDPDAATRPSRFYRVVTE